MSDFDPNRMNDLRDRDFRYGSDTGSSWAWIVGAIAVVVVILVALGLGRNDTQTASTIPSAVPPASSTLNPPSTTGMAPRPAPAEPATPAAPVAPAPATPPASTNQ